MNQATATTSDERSRKHPRETRESDLDALFREFDEEPSGALAEGSGGFPGAAGKVESKRAGGRFRSKTGQVAKTAGPLPMATGMALIVGAFLTLGVSLSLFLFLNIASLLLIALGAFLPEGSARR